ncbi:4535_t:CDS:2, partial [Gigaspora rosea]
VVKCNDTSCCRPFCSGILQLLPNQFFLSPILVQQKLHGICAASINASDNTTHFSNFLLSTLMVEKLIPHSSRNEPSAFSFQLYSEFFVSHDKGEAMWLEEDTIPEDAPELLFQEAKHIRTNQDH